MESISDVHRNRGHTRLDFLSNLLTPKYLLTLSIYFCYFSNAINYSLLGPTINSLGKIYNHPIEKISLIYTIRTFSYTIGALSGFGFKYVNRQICLIIFTIVMGLSLAALPTLPSLPIFFVIGGLNGLMSGGSDTAITAWIIELWAEKSGPFMNALHFAFGSGSIIAPLIARPFLTSNDWHLVIAYIICASIIVFSGIILALLLFSRRLRSNEVNEVIESSAQNTAIVPTISEEFNQESGRRELSPTLAMTIAIMGCLLLATYVAMEMTYFSFESTFVQYSRYNMSEADAAVLSSTTSLVFTLTRGVEILVSLTISPHLILLMHFLTIIAFNLMAILTYDLPLYWVWISNIGIGIGCGSVYPTIYSFLQQNFQIDNKKTAILLFVGGCVGALYPYIVGSSIVDRPLVLMFVNITSIIVCIILLFSIKLITRKFSHVVRPQLVLITDSDQRLSPDIDHESRPSSPR